MQMAQPLGPPTKSRDSANRLAEGNFIKEKRQTISIGRPFERSPLGTVRPESVKTKQSSGAVIDGAFYSDPFGSRENLLKRFIVKRRRRAQGGPSLAFNRHGAGFYGTILRPILPPNENPSAFS